MINDGLEVAEEPSEKGVSLYMNDGMCGAYNGITFQNYDELLEWCQDLLDRGKKYFKV